MSRTSRIKKLVKRDMVRVNKLNHSTAVLAQITCQINSSKGTVFEVSQFLPYPTAEVKIVDLQEYVLLTFLMTVQNLDQNLFSIASDVNIIGKVSASYYWGSNGFIYE